jgi:hypothetical protein
LAGQALSLLAVGDTIGVTSDTDIILEEPSILASDAALPVVLETVGNDTVLGLGVILEGRVATEAGLPVVRSTAYQLALPIFLDKRRSTGAFSLFIIPAPSLFLDTLSINQQEPIHTASALDLPTDDLVFVTVSIFGVAYIIDQQIAILASGASVAVVLTTILNHTNVVLKNEGSHTLRASLGAVLPAA